jgi:hypothetical protein
MKGAPITAHPVAASATRTRPGRGKISAAHCAWDQGFALSSCLRHLESTEAQPGDAARLTQGLQNAESASSALLRNAVIVNGLIRFAPLKTAAAVNPKERCADHRAQPVAATCNTDPTQTERRIRGTSSMREMPSSSEA